MIRPENSALFGPFAISWLATWAAVKLKASAYREYESVTRRHLIPAFGSLRLDELGPDRVQGYVASRIIEGLAPRTVDNHVIILKRILGVAVGYGLIPENPVDLVARPRSERAEMKFLRPSELQQLIAATPEPWRLLIALPALVGLRKGECLALLGSDFDLDACTVSITKSMRAGIVSSPKTRWSVGACPFPQSLRSLIARRRTSGSALIFSKRDGSPLSDATPNRVLGRALEAAGLPQIRFHDLRHSWAVAHLRAGTDVKTLAALGRWSSPMALLETYAHVIPTIGGEAVRRFDEFVHDTLNE